MSTSAVTADRCGRWVVPVASVLGALTVLIGAFGAHGLKKVLEPALLEVYQMAVQYQFIHVLALLLVGVLLRMSGWPDSSARYFRASAVLFLFGITLFCGSLYALSLTSIRTLGIITPFGGILFVLGWLALAWGASKR